MSVYVSDSSNCAERRFLLLLESCIPRTHFVTIVCFVGDSWIAAWTALSIREPDRFRQNTGPIVRQFGMAESGSR